MHAIRTFPLDSLDELVGTEVLADYYSAPWGHFLGVYPNGEITVGEAIGREIDPDEQPVVTVKCPGIGNIDMTWWRSGWDCDHLTDEEVVRDCCENGDVEEERQELIRCIQEAAKD
jgi:hypothetical protein